MGVFKVDSSGGQNVYTKQGTSAQVTLKNSKLKDVVMKQGEYAYLNQPSELFLDTPTNVVYDYTVSPSVIKTATNLNANDTDQNRHSATLSTGEIIFLVAVTGTLYVQRSTDGGKTFSQLCTIVDDVASGKYGIVKNGRKLGIVYARNATDTLLKFVEIDYDTVTNVDKSGTAVIVDTIALLRRNCGISYVNGKYWILSSGRVSASPELPILYESVTGASWTRTVLPLIDTATNAVVIKGEAQYNGKPVFIEETFLTAGSLYKIQVRYWNGSAWVATQLSGLGTNDKTSFKYDNFSNIGKIGVFVQQNTNVIQYVEWDNTSVSGTTTVATGTSSPYIQCEVDFNDVMHVCYRPITSSQIVERTSADNFAAEVIRGTPSSGLVAIEGLNFSSLPYAYNDTDVKLNGKWIAVGSIQSIPAFETYTNISQIIALGKGTLKSSNSIPKQYVGNITKKEVTY